MRTKIIILGFILTLIFASNAVATGYVAGVASHATLYADTITSRGNTGTVTVNDNLFITSTGVSVLSIGTTGVLGMNSADNNVRGTLGTASVGVLGQYSNGNTGYLAGSSYGAYGKNLATGNEGSLGGPDYGVRGRGIGVPGVYGSNGANYGYLGSASYGVYGSNGVTYGYLGGGTYGVYGRSNDYAVYGQCTDVDCYGLYTPDKMRADNGIRVGPAAVCEDFNGPLACQLNDIAEDIYSKDELENGDVVVIDAENDEHVKLSSKPYDTLAAGIISLNPAFYIQTSNTGIPLALAGRVKAKASAENGPIKRGDLLTTSSTPGHLMRCESNEKCLGSVVGKALEPLNKGKGEIVVLVTLG